MAKAGKPLDADDTAAPRRPGFLDGAFAVPKMGRADVERLFDCGT